MARQAHHSAPECFAFGVNRAPSDEPGNVTAVTFHPRSVRVGPSEARNGYVLSSVSILNAQISDAFASVSMFSDVSIAQKPHAKAYLALQLLPMRRITPGSQNEE